MTPEERRDAAQQAVIAAGGVIVAATPLATADAPHTVVAYRLRVGIPDPEVADAVAAARDDTETSLTGLIDWTPEEVPDESSGY